MISISAIAILAADEGTELVKSGYGGLIFMGCFFLALIVIFIWWLKR